MRKCYRNLLVTTCFTLLVGCHSMRGNDLMIFQPSDAAITTAVQDAIHHDAHLAHSKVHVQTMHGDVLLTGHVRTIRQSDMAEAITKKVDGVKSVHNDIVIRK